MLWAIYSGVWTATHKHIKLVPDGNKSNKLFKKDLHISLHCIVLTGIGTMGFSPPIYSECSKGKADQLKVQVSYSGEGCDILPFV